ncbi:MAG TPA: hypothetical protein VNO23_10210 [Candidatus Binatia bacterium]|nr:hypothetical protein [Candidatus Binatia bacterium]
MLVLPRPPRRAWVRAFWIVVSVMVGGLVAVLAALLTLPAPLARFGPGPVGAGAALVVLLAGLLMPRLAVLGYRAWSKATRRYARFAGEALIAVWYPVLFGAVGLGGSALLRRRPEPGQTLWRAHSTLDADTYRSLDERPAVDTGGWLGRYARWAVRSRHLWALALVPLLALLAALETEEPEEAPAGIYTLF